MAGSSAITLHRSEDATILLQFQARQAAKTYAADLTAGELTVGVATYPTQLSVVSLQPDEPVLGCSLALVDPTQGAAELFLPKSLWAGQPNRRFVVTATLDSGATVQRLGTQIFDLTD